MQSLEHTRILGLLREAEDYGSELDFMFVAGVYDTQASFVHAVLAAPISVQVSEFDLTEWGLLLWISAQSINCPSVVTLTGSHP